MHPLISVIIANYNNEPYIPACLDSVLSQTFKDIEIVIYDDASTGSAPEILHRYRETYPGVVKVIDGAVNRGVSHARHAAISEAKGKYITTLDSDDIYYNPRKLQNEIELICFHKEKHNRDVCAFSNTAILDKDLKFIKSAVTQANLREGDIFNHLITRQCFVPRDILFPRSAYFEVGGFDPAFKIREDWDLKIRLSKRFQFYYTNEFGTGYRKHALGLSTSSLNRDSVYWLEKVFQKNLPLVEEADKARIIQHFGEFIKRKLRK